MIAASGIPGPVAVTGTCTICLFDFERPVPHLYRLHFRLVVRSGFCLSQQSESIQSRINDGYTVVLITVHSH